MTFKQKALYVHTSKEIAEKNSLIKTPFIHNFSHSYLPTYLRVNTDITSSFIKLLWLLFVYNLHIFCVFRISPSKRCCHFKANSKVNKVQHVHPLIIGCFFECRLNFHRIVCGLTAQTPHKQWWWTTDWLRTTEQQPPYHRLVRHKGTTAFVSHSVCLTSRRIATLYWHRKRFICTFLNRAIENKNIYLKYCRCCLIKKT